MEKVAISVGTVYSTGRLSACPFLLYPEDTVGIFNFRPFYAVLLDKHLLAKSKVFNNNGLFTPEDEPEKLKDEFRKDFQVDFSRIFS